MSPTWASWAGGRSSASWGSEDEAESITHRAFRFAEMDEYGADGLPFFEFKQWLLHVIGKCRRLAELCDAQQPDDDLVQSVVGRPDGRDVLEPIEERRREGGQVASVRAAVASLRSLGRKLR